MDGKDKAAWKPGTIEKNGEYQKGWYCDNNQNEFRDVIRFKINIKVNSAVQPLIL